MGKSRKRPDSQVVPDPAFVTSPATLIENEKQASGCKKQKTDNGDKEQDFEKNNIDKDTEENTKEEQNISSEDNKVEVSPTIKSAETTQDANKAIITNGCKVEEGEDNNNEDHQHLETPIESIDVPPVIESAETSQDTNIATISSEYEEEDRDNNLMKSETDVEMLDAPSTKKMDQTPLSSESLGSKTVLMDNLSFLIKEEDVTKFFKDVGEIAEIHFDMKEDYFTGRGHVEFTTPEAAQEALKLNNTSLLDRPLKLLLATERGEEQTKTTPHAIGSKTVFVGNLSFQIEEDDLRDLFKDVGEIAAIRFAIRHERFLGHGYVDFTTAEAAQEALKLDDSLILDRKVKLDLARERGAYTPNSSSLEKSNQRGGHAQTRTLYVRGFDYGHGFDEIRSTLEKHFGKCGEISRIHIPQNHESGGPRGVAFIDFADSDAFSQALKLDKSEIGGCKIVVEEAKKHRVDGREGSGYGGGSGGGWGRDGGSGGGESGSGSGWSRSNDHGGGSGRSGGGWSRGNNYSGGSDRSVGGGWSRGNDYHGGSGRSIAGSVGGWSRGNDYGSGSGVSWHRDGGTTSRGILGRGSGYGGSWSGGGGFSSSRVGRFSGGYGGSRGGGGRR